MPRNPEFRCVCPCVRELPLRRAGRGSYLTENGNFMLCRVFDENGKPKWVALDNRDPDDAARPLSFGPTEDKFYDRLYDVAWVLLKYEREAVCR